MTEWLLLQLAKRHKGPTFDVRAFSKSEEANNGADWEFWFADCHVGILVRVQAKRLFASGRYESLFKPPPNQFAQLDKLTSNAGAAWPLYVFYNASGAFGSPGNTCPNPRFYGPSYWGCSIASPAFVRATANDHAVTLSSGVLPWHCLVCHCPACSGGPGGSPTLPYRVAGALNALPRGEKTRGEGSEHGFAEAGALRPDWVDVLLREEASVENDRAAGARLEEYLLAHELAGVAMIRENREPKG